MVTVRLEQHALARAADSVLAAEITEKMIANEGYSTLRGHQRARAFNIVSVYTPRPCPER